MSQLVDVAVIGAGPAGLAAALKAKESGAGDVTIIERAEAPGGLLNQCIHNGFGLFDFDEDLTGPEFAKRFIENAMNLNIHLALETMVLNLTPDKQITACNKKGIVKLKAKAVVLAMGCRERTAGAIQVPGTRPAGVYTAGTAQHFVNLQNIMVGKRIVVLGSGDIGLIMARRMTLEGAKVEAVFEILPYAGGLARNIQQCLIDYDIPLYLNTGVTALHGKERLCGVTVAEMDKHFNLIQDTERFVSCDTLLLSVGLIPENELSREANISMASTTGGAIVDDCYMTNIPGIFSCGNVLHVHDLVDHVSEESELVGQFAAQYLEKGLPPSEVLITLVQKKGVRSVLPQKVSGLRDFTLSLRVSEPLRNMAVWVRDKGRKVARKKLVRLHPSEIIRITVKADKLQQAKTLEVSVE